MLEGWKCPVCGCGNAPAALTCGRCVPKDLGPDVRPQHAPYGPPRKWEPEPGTAPPRPWFSGQWQKAKPGEPRLVAGGEYFNSAGEYLNIQFPGAVFVEGEVTTV